MRPLFAFCSFLALPSACPSAEPVSVKLGGPRDVAGTVASDDKGYTVTARYRPFRALDAATNEEITFELGREFAAQLLGKHQQLEDGASLSLAGERLLDAGKDGDRFKVTVFWPKSGVHTLDKAERPMEAIRFVRKADFSDRFFTAKQDHLNALAAR
jgi:hypothetical protein